MNIKREYTIEKICDGCDLKTKTIEVIGLDPHRPNIINYICKRCDKSHATIPKILKYNRKNFPETHSIFGFPLNETKNISNIKIYFSNRDDGGFLTEFC